MRLAVTCTLLFFSLWAFPQKKGQELLDSMLRVLPQAGEDTNKVKLLVSISQLYLSVNPRDGFGYADSGMVLAQKISWKKGMANLNNVLGLLTGDTGNNTAARDYFQKSFVINKEIGAVTAMITNMNNTGRSYQREGDFVKASEYYFKAMAIAEEAGNKEQMALVGTNITAMYTVQNNYPKAEEYALLTIKNGEASNSLVNVAKACELLGVVKQEMQDTVAAMKNFDRAISLYEKLGNRMGMVQVMTNVATLQPTTEKGITVLLKVQDEINRISPSSIISIVNLANLGSNYYNLGLSKTGTERKSLLDKGEIYLNKSIDLCKVIHSPQYEASVKEAMANLQEAKGNYKLALEYHKAFTAINDSIYSQQNKNKIASLESQKEINIKNKEIEISKLAIANQRKLQIGLVGGILLLGVIGVLLYWQSRTRKKTNTTLMVLNNELDEANKIKTKFFGILSHDLRGPVTNLINFLHLQQEAPDLLDKKSEEAQTKRITSSAENLLENMEGLLLWSKGQMEHFKPNKRTVMAGDLFSEIENNFQGTPAVKFVFTDSQHIRFFTDEDYLKTIMRNLTANAVKALNNIPEAKIEWRAWEENGKQFLSITDNGNGVSEQQIGALNQAGASVGIKSGLGLHLVRDMAKAIQSTISFQSQPGIGTTFTLTV
jgi:signal transduction histidine kinase